MSSANDDQSSESESEKRVDRILDIADAEIWKWLLLLAIAALGTLLASVIPPKVLGASTAVLFVFWLISVLRVRQLRRRLAALAHKRAGPAHVAASQTPSLSKSEELDNQAYSVLCMIVHARDHNEVVKFEDIQKKLFLAKSSLELTIQQLERDGYIWEENDDSLQNDPGALHPLPKGISYVALRLKRPKDSTWT